MDCIEWAFMCASNVNKQLENAFPGMSSERTLTAFAELHLSHDWIFPGGARSEIRALRHHSGEIGVKIVSCVYS